MRKVFTLLLATVSTLMLTTGCEYTNIKEGFSMDTHYIELKPNYWQETGESGKEGFYQYQPFDFPEIDKTVMEYGAVLVYYIDGDGRDNPMPLVLPYYNNRTTLIQNLRFDYQQGTLTIISEMSDFQAYRQKSFKCKVCIIKP